MNIKYEYEFEFELEFEYEYECPHKNTEITIEVNRRQAHSSHTIKAACLGRLLNLTKSMNNLMVIYYALDISAIVYEDAVITYDLLLKAFGDKANLHTKLVLSMSSAEESRKYVQHAMGGQITYCFGCGCFYLWCCTVVYT